MNHSVRREIPVICPACNYGYVRGLPGEARLHAAFHARYMRQRKPRPEPRLAAFGGGVRVDAKSPRWLQRIVYRCVVGLRHVEGYNFRNGASPGRRGCPPTSGICMRWCWSKADPLRSGAVAFLRVEWLECGPEWLMMFAWVGDEWRRKGAMTRRWLSWRKTYGDFTLSSPLSSAMSAFVGKMNAWLDGAFSPTLEEE